LEFTFISLLITSSIGPVRTITTAALLYVQSVISYYMFRSLVWPSSGRKKCRYKKEKMLQKRPSLPSTINRLN